MASALNGDSLKTKTVSVISSDDKHLSGADIKAAYDPTDDLLDAEPEPFKKANDLDSTATRRSVYDDNELAPHYWPKKEYENLHRFDPKARWTFREERAIIRKIDWKVMFWAAISFSALNLDRNNLSQANTDNFLPDLNLTTDDFNWGNSIFRLAFLCAELPSQLVSKRMGPDRWIPIQMCLWSIVTIGQFWLTGRTSFFVTRALLGFIQGGFIPDLILYLSYFYTKHELPIRLAFFWISSNICSIIGSFIAFGTLRLRGLHGKAGWRWLFLVEGCITLSIGLATFFKMPPSPTQTKTWYRPKGWFTEREEVIITSRILRDDPSKGDMHNREALTPKRLWTALCDYDLWPVYILGLMFGIPITPPGQYLTLSLRNLGFNTFQSNLLTIPSSVIGMLTMFLITAASELVHDRSIGLATGLLSYPYTHPIQVGWCSRNSGAVASRTVNASVYNMFVQASTVVASQVYRKDDAPLYRRGNLILIIICLFNIVVLYPGTKAYYVWRNKQRAKVWDAMTSKEKAHYLETTKDIGNRRLDFRFAH
ncbi:allantoate permease [Cyathus striatus]|nr:allantoate permease [Cyathus striatus]